MSTIATTDPDIDSPTQDEPGPPVERRNPGPFPTVACPSCGDSYVGAGPAVCAACSSQACTVCAGPHRATQCPEVAALLHDRPLWDGKAIARAWHSGHPRFAATLRSLDDGTRREWAEAYSGYMNMPQLSPEYIQSLWERAISGQAKVPTSARS